MGWMGGYSEGPGISGVSAAKPTSFSQQFSNQRWITVQALDIVNDVIFPIVFQGHTPNPTDWNVSCKILHSKHEQLSQKKRPPKSLLLLAGKEIFCVYFSPVPDCQCKLWFLWVYTVLYCTVLHVICWVSYPQPKGKVFFWKSGNRSKKYGNKQKKSGVVGPLSDMTWHCIRKKGGVESCQEDVGER